MKYRWLRRRALWWTDPLGRDEWLGMRLGSKIFLASALVIVVLAGVSALSLGAVVGGWLFSLFGMQAVTGLNIYSLIVAVIGAVVFLVIYHAIRCTV